MFIQPLSNHVLVELLNNKEDGILQSIEETQFKIKGIVKAVGPDVAEDISIDDKVLFEDYGRIKIPEDEKLAIIKSTAIIGKYITKE